MWRPLPDGEWYGIPFGCLVSRDFGNVLVAGRCLSALEWHGDVRVDIPALQKSLLSHATLLEPSA